MLEKMREKWTKAIQPIVLKLGDLDPSILTFIELSNPTAKACAPLGFDINQVSVLLDICNFVFSSLRVIFSRSSLFI